MNVVDYGQWCVGRLISLCSLLVVDSPRMVLCLPMSHIRTTAMIRRSLIGIEFFLLFVEGIVSTVVSWPWVSRPIVFVVTSMLLSITMFIIVKGL